MRLTCPRCGAQYEIPQAVIPTSGREVECSACGQVWHQPGPALPGHPGEIAAKSPDPAEVAAAAPPPGFSATDRPLLSRKLDEDVLAILREEAARELSARAREGRRDGGADHNPVTALPEPIPAPGQSDADPEAFEWPVATVILPGEPLRDSDTPQPADATPEPAPPALPAEPPQPEAVAAKPARPADTPPLLPIEEPVASITEPEPEAAEVRPAQAPRLPDAARLAATLTRALPQAAPEPEPQPAATLPSSAKISPTRTMPTRSHPVPALRPQPGSGSYAAGFGLAAMLALALLGFYTLAPRIEAGAQGQGAIAEWRHGLDRARLWLHDRIAGN